MSMELTVFVIIAGCVCVALLAAITFTVDRIAKMVQQIETQIRARDIG